MSTTLGALRQLIQDAVDDQSTENAAQIDRVINQSYREVGLMHFWQALLGTQLIGSEILPGDLERIAYVQPADTDYLYFEAQLTDRYTNLKLYNWYRNLTVSTPLKDYTDMVVTANSTSVTSANGGFVEDDHKGEYIRIGVDGGIYKIAEVASATELTLDHKYRGASATDQYFEIRPEGTLKLARVDYEGSDISDDEDTLWYLKRPLPLYNDYDTIPLPGTCEAIRIMALQRQLEGDKYDNDALKQQQNFIDAVSQMKALDPTAGRETRPRDIYGQQIRFGRRYRAGYGYGFGGINCLRR